MPRYIINLPTRLPNEVERNAGLDYSELSKRAVSDAKDEADAIRHLLFGHFKEFPDRAKAIYNALGRAKGCRQYAFNYPEIFYEDSKQPGQTGERFREPRHVREMLEEGALAHEIAEKLEGNPENELAYLNKAKSLMRWTRQKELDDWRKRMRLVRKF